MATKKKMLMAAAGGAGGGEPGPDVTEVFSTYLYEGNGSAQTITNGISLGDGAGDEVYYQSSTSSVTGNLSPLSTITVTNTGGTSLDTSLAKFSTCYQFDGNADFLTLSQPVFDSATPFCFETWVRFNNVGSTSDMGMIANQYTGGQAGRMLFGGQNDQIVVRVNGGTVYLTTGSSSVSTGTWYHVAWTYDGTTHRLYLDGTLKDSDTTMPSIYTGTNTEIGGIDPNRLSDYDLFGRLEDIRVTLGKARYTGSSYTVPTAKFPQDTLAQGEGGLVWVKERTAGGNRHGLYDTERGTGKEISSNLTNAQRTVTQTLTSFNNNGFSIGTDSTVSDNGRDFSSWTFRKAPKFFDIVTYTGDGSDTREVSHNLGSKPGMIAIKSTSTSNNWVVWHRGATGSTGTINGSLTEGAKVRNAILNLNTTGALASLDNSIKAPSSTTLYFGDRNNTTEDVNVSGRTYVAYLFAHNDGDGEFGPDSDQDIIKCGSYIGNGSDQEIDIGFEPQWILTKPSTFTHDWYIWDTMRGFKTYSGTDTNNLNLKPNEANAESDFDGIALTSTGFSLHGASNAANNSGQTYIYIAIRRGPLAQPESATEVFDVKDWRSMGSSFVQTNFPVDLSIWNYYPGTATNSVVNDRLRGVGSLSQTYSSSPFLTTSSTAAENTASNNTRNYNNVGYDAASGDAVFWSWKRAPGFCDVVAYTGNGVAGRTVSHNLGVAPEMIWVKSREQARSWNAYLGPLGLSGGAPAYAVLNETDAAAYSTTRFYTTPTATEFSVGSNSRVNTSGEDYIAYLFATVPGVSKVGSYTGNGSSQTIDCGFTSGARFVLIKRTDSTGSWVVYDTERGIVSGNDAALLLQSSGAEYSGADEIDPNSSGFDVVHDANGFLTNASGASYIFYAIA